VWRKKVEILWQFFIFRLCDIGTSEYFGRVEVRLKGYSDIVRRVLISAVLELVV
jgi:hypothetical protein